MRITVITGEYPPQEGGVGDFTQQIGYALHALGHEVHVITNLDEEEAALLAVAPGVAAFHLEHVFYDFDNNPVNWGWFIWRGDRLRFTTTVGIDDTA